ncbi:MAG: hypothetical protein QOG64_3240 [Acidimicrobiaceae bacterium]|nr:hypothetical protein [Acidimicrobiaceae bacterium]
MATVAVRDRLGDNAPAWDLVVDASPLPSPFLRSWWLEAAASGKPVFVLVFDGNDLIGGVALEQHRWLGVVRLREVGSGSLCPDHVDVVARTDCRGEVLAALSQWFARPGARIVDVSGAVAQPSLIEALPGRVSARPMASAPCVELGRDFAAYLDRRPSLRQGLSRTERRLARNGAYHRIVTDPSELDRALADLRRLHEQQWAGWSRFMVGFDRFAAAARRGMAAGEVVVHELATDSEVVASMVAFETSGRCSAYQGGRSRDARWNSAGTLLLAKVAERASALDRAELDLLRGEERYKGEWSTGHRDLLQVRAGTGRMGLLALHSLVAAERLREGLKRLLGGRPETSGRTLSRRWRRPRAWGDGDGGGDGDAGSSPSPSTSVGR